MKKLSLAIIFVCCFLAVAAQDGIRVKYQGAQPTIKDFATSYLANITQPTDEDECGEWVNLYESMQKAMARQANGQPLKKGATLTIDQRNGYLLYEEKTGEHVNRVEMCYWNEADGKHKLFACNRWTFKNGKPVMGQFDGIDFCRYDNATKKMEECDTPGFEVEYMNTAYSLPRMGKDITVTTWDDNGKKTQTTLKWNGHGFGR